MSEIARDCHEPSEGKAKITIKDARLNVVTAEEVPKVQEAA